MVFKKLFKKKRKTEMKKFTNVAVIGPAHSGKSTIIELVANLLCDYGVEVNIFSKDIYNKILSCSDDHFSHDESIHISEDIKIYNNDVGCGTNFFSETDKSVRIHEFKIDELFTLNKQLSYADKIIMVQDQDIENAQINQVGFNKDNTIVIFNKFIDSKLKLKHFEKIFNSEVIRNSIINNMDLNLHRNSIDSKVTKDLLKLHGVDKETIENMTNLVEWILSEEVNENVS